VEDKVVLTEVTVRFLFPTSKPAHHCYVEHTVAQFLWGTALRAGRLRVQFPLALLGCFIDLILPAALWPWYPLSL